MLRNLLIYRLFLFNFAAIAVLFWAWQQGIVGPLFQQDATHLTYAIAALFLVGLCSVFVRGAKLSRHLNSLKEGDAEFNSAFSPAKFTAKSAHIEDIGKWLVLLGLLGTVVGFRWSLAGVDINSFSTASGTQQSLIVMLGGVFIAQGTTIVSIALALWLSINWRILSTAIVIASEDSR